MAEPEDVEIDLKPDDYRKDIFYASGPGGQHVNKTASAIRLTHYETGIVVSCQDEKSQHKNFAKALRVLKTRLYEHKREAEHEKRADERKTQIGSGDRSQRIRTYNFPENRLTDHRINLTLYKLDAIIAGNLQPRDRRPDGIRAAAAAARDGHDRLRQPRQLPANSKVRSRLCPRRKAKPGPSAGCSRGRPTISSSTARQARGWTPKCCWPHAAGCQRIELYTRFDEPAPEALRTGFRDLVRRRAEGTPVAYLVGRREFYSLSFRVTPDVLIPRPETELLVVALLDRIRAQRRGRSERGRRRHRHRHHRHLRGQICCRRPCHGHRHQPAGLGSGPRQRRQT